ncbi:MAG: TRAP transporter fused permease subunit [Chloroflexi bacterium]|nr:TRAP transporter fused permease subunit [Chloroflexota bacterium]
MSQAIPDSKPNEPQDGLPIKPPEISVERVEEIVATVETPTRKFTGRIGKFLAGGLVVMSLYHLYNVLATIPTQLFRATHVLFILFFIFLVYPAAKRWKEKIPWFDWMLALAGVASMIYIFVDFEEFVYRPVIPNQWDVLFGGLAILLILEATRRSVGTALMLLVAGFIAYALFGAFLPSPWDHRGFGFDRLVGQTYMTLEGIFGVPIDVSSTYIILFTLYGAILDQSGAGKFFVNLAFGLMGRRRSGAGQTVTFASFLLGGPSGSGVATTVTLGAIAYPLLKKAGYSKEAAGGLLSAGGIGAVISPPILGAAAFIIAEILRISYLEVIAMAIVPTLLFYYSIVLMTELEARRFALQQVEIDAESPLRLVTRYWYLLSSLIVIVIFLLMGFTAMMAVFWSIMVAILLSILRSETAIVPRWIGVVMGVGIAVAIALTANGVAPRETPGLAAMALLVFALILAFVRRDAQDVTRRLYQALESGSRQVLNVAVTCAAAGILVGVVTLTGLGLRFSDIIISLAGGQLFFTLVLAAIVLWILGLALPITASYIIAAVIVAPAIIKVGVPEYAAHMFIFYYAILSEVSPPVGLSPIAAAAITGGNPFKTMMQAWKYTLPAFIVPFMFTLSPAGGALLFKGTPVEIIWATVSAMVGLTALACGVAGWLVRPLNLLWRAPLVIAGLLLVYPETTQDMIGIGIFLFVLLAQLVLQRRAPAKPALA